MLLHPAVTLFEKRWRWPRGLTSFSLIFLFFCLVFVSSYLVIKRLMYELTTFFAHIPIYIENISLFFTQIEQAYMTPFLTYIQRLVPLQDINQHAVTELLMTKLQGNITEIVQVFLMFTSEFISSFTLGSFIILFIMIATYFMTKDHEQIMTLIKKGLPMTLTPFPRLMKKHAFSSIVGLLKTQLFIAFITAFVSLVALALFQVKHSLLIVSFIFIIDLIPYVGIGLWFIPWILYSFFTGDYVTTIQITSLYIVLIILRQIIEPRLLAKSLGIHPLVTMIILFLNIHLFGALGLFLAPISLIVLSSIYHTKIIHYIVRYIKEGAS